MKSKLSLYIHQHTGEKGYFRSIIAFKDQFILKVKLTKL